MPSLIPPLRLQTTESPLKWQTRVVSCFQQANGFAIGSIEGRVGIQYVEDKMTENNFSFKCHRDTTNNVFSVNSIAFHPIYGTFSTAGSDGTFNFWDKDSKQRLKQFNNVGGPIVASAFSRNGAIFSYAMGYDWSKVGNRIGIEIGHSSRLFGKPNLDLCSDRATSKTRRKTTNLSSSCTLSRKKTSSHVLPNPRPACGKRLLLVARYPNRLDFGLDETFLFVNTQKPTHL